MSVSAEEPARPERARVVRLRRVAFRAQLDGPAREDDHQLREHYAVLSGAGTSGARKFEILREGLPEYGKTCRSAAQFVESPLPLRLLSLPGLLVPHRPLALLAERRVLREKGESVGRRQIILVETAGRARKPAGYSSKIE